MAKSLVSLKKEATELGLTFEDDVKATELEKQIDAYYASQETSGAELMETVAKVEAAKAETPEVKVKGIGALAKKAEEEARKTRIIKVFDNDSRVNNVTTVAVANCTNQYFDLGTVYIPLNEAVEVMVGHINTLKEVMIPHHSQGAGGMTKTTMRHRYTISYEDV